ncbi:MAG: hypothetical protein ACPH14_08510, partial [Candidatus Puniceispirillaceae bacterium]
GILNQNGILNQKRHITACDVPFDFGGFISAVISGCISGAVRGWSPGRSDVHRRFQIVIQRIKERVGCQEWLFV